MLIGHKRHDENVHAFISVHLLPCAGDGPLLWAFHFTWLIMSHRHSLTYES
jgi:hypothetical protein